MLKKKSFMARGILATVVIFKLLFFFKRALPVGVKTQGSPDLLQSIAR